MKKKDSCMDIDTKIMIVTMGVAIGYIFLDVYLSLVPYLFFFMILLAIYLANKKKPKRKNETSRV